MWWDSKKEYLKIVNSSNDDKCWGWAAGRRRRNLAWIWISQHLNGTSRQKRYPCAKWLLEQVCVPSQPFSTLTGMLRNSLKNILPIFLLVLLCFIKPILGNRYVRSRGFIVSKPRETHPRSDIADVPTSPCPPSFFFVLNPHSSTPSTAGTSTGGGTVIRKPGSA